MLRKDITRSSLGDRATQEIIDKAKLFHGKGCMQVGNERVNIKGITSYKKNVIYIDENNGDSNKSFLDKKRRITMTLNKFMSEKKVGEGREPSSRSLL